MKWTEGAALPVAPAARCKGCQGTGAALPGAWGHRGCFRDRFALVMLGTQGGHVAGGRGDPLTFSLQPDD